MKKVIFGAMMFSAGLISTAMLLAGSIANEWIVDGQLSSFWNLSQYGLMPAFYIFSGIAVLGVGMAIWGLFEK